MSVMNCKHNYVKERPLDPCSRTQWVCKYCDCTLNYAPTDPIVGEHNVIRDIKCQVCCEHVFSAHYSSYGEYLECTKCNKVNFLKVKE